MHEIEFQNGGETLRASLLPARLPVRSPAIILLPAIAGVNDYVIRRGYRLAERGYGVLVLDYYAREKRAPDVSTPERIGMAVEALSDARVLSDIAACADALRGRPDIDPEKIATFGFCIGGTYAYLAGCEIDGIAAAVDYYGSIRYAATSLNKPVSPLDRAAALRAPLLAHFGTADRLIGATDIAAFDEALRSHGRSYELFTYGGAPHAFDEDFRPVFRPAAAADAWRRSMAFLDWHCRGVA